MLVTNHNKIIVISIFVDNWQRLFGAQTELLITEINVNTKVNLQGEKMLYYTKCQSQHSFCLCSHSQNDNNISEQIMNMSTNNFETFPYHAHCIYCSELK